jgi:hypothetical protein
LCSVGFGFVDASWMAFECNTLQRTNVLRCCYF